MRIVKKYANRKLYDTVDKRYIVMDTLSELIKSGEEVTVIDNRTGEDITAAAVSQLLARESGAADSEDASGVLIQLLRKGGGAIRDYADRYASLWRGTLHMAEDGIDRIVGHLVREKELSEPEGEELKSAMARWSDNWKKWIGRNIDRRVAEVLARMNLATRDQVDRLVESVEELTRKVDRLQGSGEGERRM